MATPSGDGEFVRFDEPQRRVSLVAFHNHGAETLALSPGESVTIGREPPADLVISDLSLSRSHACFTLVDSGHAVEVEDLSSTNGTFVQGKRVDFANVALGEDVVLGGVVVSVRTSASVVSVGQGLERHDGFCRILEREVKRARFLARQFCVVLMTPHAATTSSEWWQQLMQRLRPMDCAGVYSSKIAELILPETEPTEGHKIAKEICDEIGAKCAIAAFPRTATTGQRLLESARSTLRLATGGVSINEAPPQSTRTLSSIDDEAPIAESKSMREVFALVDRVARAAVPVMVCGETGSGKEVIAQAIHERSSHRSGSLVCVNCGAIPPQLVVSTLFGHMRGAFSGADSDREGMFEAAHQGTILLDEIGELPPEAQAALLRVLETKRVMRVGATREREVDVRVLAATHRDLEAMCQDGRFREDLYFRLNVMTIDVPPLRERTADIAPLADRFLRLASKDNGRYMTGFSDEARAAMSSYDWPGNVRELKNVVERAVVIAGMEEVNVGDLPQAMQSQTQRMELASAPSSAGVHFDDPPTWDGSRADSDGAFLQALLDDRTPLKDRLQDAERELITRALAACDYNQSRAAEVLGMPRRTLVYKIRTLQVATGASLNP